MSETTNKWEFRELNSTDLFPTFNLLNKIGVKELKSCIDQDFINSIISSDEKKSESAKSEAANRVGLDIVLNVAGLLISNLGNCSNEIYGLLEKTSNLSRKQLEELSPAELAEMIFDFVKKPEFKDFILVVSKLFK